MPSQKKEYRYSKLQLTYNSNLPKRVGVIIGLYKISCHDLVRGMELGQIVKTKKTIIIFLKTLQNSHDYNHTAVGGPLIFRIIHSCA